MQHLSAAAYRPQTLAPGNRRRGSDLTGVVHIDLRRSSGRGAVGCGGIERYAQQGLLQHLQQELIRNQELADVMRGILQERGIQ